MQSRPPMSCVDTDWLLLLAAWIAHLKVMSSANRIPPEKALRDQKSRSIGFGPLTVKLIDPFSNRTYIISETGIETEDSWVATHDVVPENVKVITFTFPHSDSVPDHSSEIPASLRDLRMYRRLPGSMPSGNPECATTLSAEPLMLHCVNAISDKGSHCNIASHLYL
jgi:hypothetical protein